MACLKCEYFEAVAASIKNARGILAAAREVEPLDFPVIGTTTPAKQNAKQALAHLAKAAQLIKEIADSCEHDPGDISRRAFELADTIRDAMRKATARADRDEPLSKSDPPQYPGDPERG